ncbi:MAG: hypothetical protein AB1726_08665 [Planctomycetota bacterium]
MPLPLHLPRLSELIDALLEAPGEEARDRILLAAVFHLEAAQAAAVWRPVPEPGSTEGRWRPVLQHGPADVLPPRAAVEATLSGTLACTLPHGGKVLRSALPRPGVALALGGGEPAEEAMDALEALLALRSRIDLPAARPDSPLDVLQALLPDGSRGDSLPPWDSPGRGRAST